MEIQKIENDLFLCIGDAYDSNSMVLLHGTDAFLIDCMASKKDAEELKDFVEVKLNKSVRFILCTHYFSDHLAGLKYFPSSHILAHQNYRETFDSEMHRTKEEKSFFAEPSILISSELTIRWGRYRLGVFYNPGHTMSMLNVDIPEADLIHVGDTLVGNMVYFKYSYPAAFFPAFEKIKERGRKYLLSSHAEIRSIQAVDSAHFYLQSLQRKASEVWRTGSEKSVLEIELNECLPSGMEGTSFENIFHKRNLKTILEKRFFEPENAVRSAAI